MPIQIGICNAIGAGGNLAGGGPGPGPTPPLDTYTGAAAAFSVRLLRTAYSGSALRVRRAVRPYDEQDIGFTEGGDLDEAAIVAFGGSDELRVSAWYDQSGQSNHATQPTAGNQPQIYDGISVITENGKPAIQAGILSFSGITMTSVGFQVFNVFTHSGQNFWVGNSQSNRFSIQYANNGTLAYQGTFTGIRSINGTFTVGQQNLISVGDDGSKTVASINGSPAADSTGYPSANLPENLGRLVNSAFGVALNSNYRGQEILIWNSDQFDNRTGIETDINDYYEVLVNDEAATSGFLFDYPNSTAAYSVRQLNNNAGYAMRVERSDGRTKNIGFDGNGDLDTQAIIDFAGASVATVRLWFDQTGNQNHASLSQNPVIIYDGTSIISRSGIPAVQNGTNVGRMEFSPISIPASGGYTTFAAKGSQSNWGAVITGGWYPRTSSQGWIVSQGTTIANFLTTNLFDEMVMTSRKDGNDYDMWRNTTSLYSNTLGTAYVGGPFEELFRGERSDPNSTVDDGLLHEAIFYDSALPDATVTNIQNNLITQYSL